jgi:hypothetical protein
MTSFQPAETVTAFTGATSSNRAMMLQGSSCETVQEIIDIAATAEAFAVTLLGEALAASERGEFPLNPDAVGTLTAARAAEQAHFDVLTGAGAEPLTMTFTVPDPDLLTNVGMFFTTLISLEEAFIAAYTAAAQEFAIQGNADLAKLALQIGAVEAEHRAGARFFAIEAGAISGVPNDVAFEKALFTSVGQAAAALMDLGFIGGDGTEISYPGPGEIDTTGVTNLEP